MLKSFVASIKVFLGFLFLKLIILVLIGSFTSLILYFQLYQMYIFSYEKIFHSTSCPIILCIQLFLEEMQKHPTIEPNHHLFSQSHSSLYLIFHKFLFLFGFILWNQGNHCQPRNLSGCPLYPLFIFLKNSTTVSIVNCIVLPLNK